MKEPAIFAALAAILCAALYLFQGESRNRSSAPEEVAEIKADARRNGAMAMSRGASRGSEAAPAKCGSLRISFEMRFNGDFHIVVMEGKEIEKSETFGIRAAPGIRRDLANSDARIENLKPGRKQIAVLTGFGFVLETLECVIRAGEETSITMKVEESGYDAQKAISGRVVDLCGRPIEGAEIRLKTHFDGLAVSGEPREIISKSSGVAPIRWHGTGHGFGENGEQDYYSESYVKFLMSPMEVPAGIKLKSFKLLSNGDAFFSDVTDTEGSFRFNMRDDVSYEVTVEYEGVTKQAAVRSGGANEIVMPAATKEKEPFEAFYEKSMRSMLFKEMNSYNEMKNALIAASSDPSAGEISARFDQMVGRNFDFYSKDLDARNSFITEARQVAYEISQALAK